MVGHVVKQGKPIAVIALTAAALATPCPARAHPEFSPQTVNRYALVVVLPARIEISFALLFGQLPAADERRLIDANGDGIISGGEIDRAQERWTRDASRLFTLRSDGTPVPMVFTSKLDTGGNQTVSAVPLVMEIHGEAALAAGSHRLKVELSSDPPHPGEAQISLDVTPGWEIVSKQTRFLFSGPRLSALEDRSATFEVRSASRRTEHAPIPGGRGVPVAAGISALAAAAAAAFARRRRKTLNAVARDK